MTTEAGSYNGNSTFDQSPEELYSRGRKEIEKYGFIILFTLLAAVLLLCFDAKIFRLLAGILVIAAASTGLMLYRKSLTLSRNVSETLKAFSSQSEKKDDVIVDFSHRIREPLNNLVIVVDMLIESGLQKKQKDLLDTFLASTNNMVTILNELTMKSAGNLGFQQRKAIRFNLLSTIQNTFELYNLKDKANIDFILNKKEFVDLDCLGDPIIVKQIFLDLFNTIEIQASDRPTKVTISLKKEKESGMENQIGLRIQTDRSIVLIDDTGTEISLSARLITSSRGTYKQEVGNNSTVLNITLPFISPIQEPRQKVISHKMEELIQKEKSHKDMKDLKILLVEDNLINQKITLLTLMPLVNIIDTATNGKEALDKFGTNNYDLILMDIKMPIMSGLVAAEKIRALEATTNTHVPIIAITANAMLGDKEKCLSAGIDDYLSKPYQPSALINKIKSLI